MSSVVFELADLYQKTFGSRPYVVQKVTPKEIKGDSISIVPENYNYPMGGYQVNQKNTNTPQVTSKGSIYQDTYLGVEIWLPTTLFDNAFNEFYLPYTVIRVMGKSQWVKTNLNERVGSVKELYSIDDYDITINGFFIDKENRFFPTSDLEKLKSFHESGNSLRLSNALTDIFFDKDTKVVIESFDLPEVRGGKKHVRPFTMKLASDNIFTLIYTGS